MDSLQEQVSKLSERIDALHQVIERLSEKFSDSLVDLHTSSGDDTHLRVGSASNSSLQSRYQSHLEAAIEHKDILLDDMYPETDSQRGERVLSPEVQIQRLTAQLTAAYNRIAALEEQLLSQRIH